MTIYSTPPSIPPLIYEEIREFHIDLVTCQVGVLYRHLHNFKIT